MPPSPPTGPPGQEPDWHPPLVFDEYQLLWMLGRGGMGAVYLGHDKLLDRPVAIKFLSSVVRDQKLRERYLIEARTAARLQHSNVVTIHRVGEIDGRLYIVTEYVRGQTLDSLAKPMAWQQAMELGVGLARGLAEAHRRGVLHRDIKPGNAILADTGEIKLLDFGLAKFLENSQQLPTSQLSPASSSSSDALKAPTIDFSDPNAVASVLQPHQGRANVVRPGRADKSRWLAGEIQKRDGRSSGGYRRLVAASSIKGTPMYMAPEVLSGLEATRRSDIYSMGALLFELAAGVPPYYDVPLDQLITVVPNRDAPPLSHIAPGIDPRFAAIIDRCLRRNPGERFASGEQLLEALEHIAPRSDLALPEGNPYRGLWAFEAEHRALYFGRRGETGTVIERLRSEPGVVVVGDSGVGKSSFCHAGLMPLIQDGLLDQTNEWLGLSLTPGRHPFRRLLESLASVFSDHSGAPPWLAQLSQAPETLGELLTTHAPGNKALLLVVDQLEELLAAPSDEAQKFARALGSLHRLSPRTRLLASLRSAHIAKIAALPGLAEWIDSSLYRLRPLSLERLREAIVGPAHAKGFLFQPAAVAEQLADSAAECGGSLPLLALTLAELWEARIGNVMSDTALSAIGGVGGSITRHADHVLGTLLGDRRLLARRLLCALARPQASLSSQELLTEDPAAGGVLDLLVRTRLVHERATAEGPRYELSHTVLQRSWPTLQRWMSDPRSSDPSHPALSSSAQSLPTQPPRRHVLKIALIASSVVAAGATAQYVRSRSRRNSHIDEYLQQAEREIAAARGLYQQLQVLRERSLQTWVDGRSDDASRLLAETRQLTLSAERAFARAGNQLETALHLDGAQTTVRNRLADVLHERALVAEAGQQEMLQEDLLQRLSLHDSLGHRRQLWQQPARLTIASTPDVVTVRVTLYSQTSDLRWQQQSSWSLGTSPLPRSELSAGAYVLHGSAPGYRDVAVAVILNRASDHRVQLSLSPQGSTP